MEIEKGPFRAPGTLSTGWSLKEIWLALCISAGIAGAGLGAMIGLYLAWAFHIMKGLRLDGGSPTEPGLFELLLCYFLFIGGGVLLGAAVFNLIANFPVAVIV